MNIFGHTRSKSPFLMYVNGFFVWTWGTIKEFRSVAKCSLVNFPLINSWLISGLLTEILGLGIRRTLITVAVVITLGESGVYGGIVTRWLDQFWYFQVTSGTFRSILVLLGHFYVVPSWSQNRRFWYKSQVSMIGNSLMESFLSSRTSSGQFWYFWYSVTWNILLIWKDGGKRRFKKVCLE